MIVVVNTIAGPGENSKVVEGFKHAMPAMKQFQGFLGMEIWTAPDGSMQAISRWASKEALDEYTSSPLFQRHHRGANSEAAHTPAQTAYYTSEQIS